LGAAAAGQFDLMLDLFKRFCYALRVNIKNRTKYRSLDRLANDPRCEKIWSEEDKGDGIWLMLADGLNLDGCCVVHEYSARDLQASFKRVKVGPTY
jgi:hypothetical protein